MILVVDDNPKIKEGLEFALPEYSFRSAATEAAALELLEKPHEVDLILLDLRLRNADGMDTLKKIKNLAPSLPVIILTGFASKENILEALRNRADDFIEKPPNPDQLRAKIGRALDAGKPIRKKAAKYSPVIQRVLRLMEKNYDRFLTLENVSEIVCLSPKYISRLFRSEVGVSFVRFRSRVKTQCAKRLLSDSSQRVHQVASRIGYQNVVSFMRMFKKVAGCTPTQYRLRNSAEDQK